MSGGRDTKRVFVSWSGGKDSSLALYRAMRNGLKIASLFTMLGPDGSMSTSHGLTRDVLDVQAKAIGIPIVYGKASARDYEMEFKRIIRYLKRGGVEGGVFGDINLQEHREWIERVCSEVEAKPFLPVWREDYDKMLNEFFDYGFEAIIISARTALVDSEWIGQPFNKEFVRYLDSNGLDRLGERGEFHTLVTNGPIFRHPLRILELKKTTKNDRWVPQKLRVEIAQA
jgi:uncharacterized protein (TIGR00290 family)